MFILIVLFQALVIAGVMCITLLDSWAGKFAGIACALMGFVFLYIFGVLDARKNRTPRPRT